MTPETVNKLFDEVTQLRTPQIDQVYWELGSVARSRESELKALLVRIDGSQALEILAAAGLKTIEAFGVQALGTALKGPIMSALVLGYLLGREGVIPATTTPETALVN